MSAADVADRVIYAAGVLSLSMTVAVLTAAGAAWIRETRRARAARRRAQAELAEAWADLRVAAGRLHDSFDALQPVFADMRAAADALVAELARPSAPAMPAPSHAARRPLPPS